MGNGKVSGRGGCVILAVAILALLAGGLGKQFLDNLDIPGSVVVGFERQNELTVFAAQVVTVPTSRVRGFVGLLDRTQTDIYRARVRYTVDLSRLTKRDVQWNPVSKSLSITVPPVKVEAPELDGASKRTFREGPPAAEATWDEFARSNVIKARREAVRLAGAPELMRLANDSARDAIAGNAALFLHGAGVAGAKVVVRFATEGNITLEQMDRSRSLDEVYRNAGSGRGP